MRRSAFSGVALGALMAALGAMPLTLMAPETIPPPAKSNEGFRRRALRSRHYPQSSIKEGRKFTRQVEAGRLRPENGLEVAS